LPRGLELAQRPQFLSSEWVDAGHAVLDPPDVQQAVLDHGDDLRQILIQGRSDSVLLVASGADGDGAGNKENGRFPCVCPA
jgi:hypothetical protein